MNILFFVPGGVTPGGKYGIIPALVALLNHLTRRHTVTVIAQRQLPELCSYPLAGAMVVNLGYTGNPFSKWNILRQFWRLNRFLQKYPTPIDLIHVLFWGWPSTFGLLAGRWLNVPVIASLGGGEMVGIQDIQYGGYLNWRRRWHSRMILRFADRVTAGSQYALRQIAPYRADVQCIPLFPENHRFFQTASVSPGPPWQLLTVSTVNRVKDPPTLLRAIRLVAEQIPDIVLDWVGEDILNGEAARLAESLDITEKVRFHGFQEYDALPAYYQRAQVYVQASRHESQGVSVCEAAAAGRPLVGTDVGILSDLARQTPAAALNVPVADHRALASAIIRVLTDNGLRQQLSQDAFRWAERHTAAQTAAHFEALYANLIQRS